MKVYIIADRCAASWLPANKKLRRPIAIGRIVPSIKLLSIFHWPFSVYLQSSTQLRKVYCTAFPQLLFGNISTNEVMKSPIKTAVKWGSKQIEILSFDNNIFYLILSVLLTLFMLYMIVKVLRKMVLSKVEVFFDKYIFKTAIRALLFGMLLTFMVQSSSITTSLIVPLAGAGVLSLRQIFPFTLGANIGTTVTALLAALTGTVSALIAAISHLLFNIFGILIIYGTPPLRAIPLKLAEMIAEYSVKNKLFPIAYLLIVFVAIPLIIILLGGQTA